MSAFLEYLKLIPKVLQNPDKVLEGWLNDIKLESGELPEDEIKEILRRRAICSSCPFSSDLAKTSKEYEEVFGKHYETDRTEPHCSCCGCFLGKKTASLSSECGLASNDKTMNIELKWKKYKTND